METLALSVIMPALNEEKSILEAIGDTLKAMDDFSIEGQIIIVNDGSTDKTGELVAEAMNGDNRITTIHHDTPKGIGASFWDGVDAATGAAVIMLPGDNENDPCEIFRYFDLLQHVDIVIPFLYNREVRPLFRNILSFIYRFIINTTFLVNINYTNGTVLYRKDVLLELNSRSTSFFFQTDILVRLVKEGYLFAEVPYKVRKRDGGKSKAITFPSLMQVIKGYFQLVKDVYRSGNSKLKKYVSGTMTENRRNNS
jgi:glycosyltransferase involved in cell wall biosynthesis